MSRPRAAPGAGALTDDHPLAHDCPECGARAGFFCEPVGDEPRPSATHPARHASAGALVHEPLSCFLCGADLSGFRKLPYGERIFKIAGFHVVDDAGRAHLGSLCWPCHHPDASWHAVAEKIRADAKRRLQPPLLG